MRGFQVEIADTTKMGLWHHSLSPEKYRSHLATAGQFVCIGTDGKKKTTQRAAPAKVKSFCRNYEWNELVVIAKGPCLVQRINHVVFAELVDEDAEYAARPGLLALQDHGKPSEVLELAKTNPDIETKVAEALKHKCNPAMNHFYPGDVSRIQAIFVVAKKQKKKVLTT